MLKQILSASFVLWLIGTYVQASAVDPVATFQELAFTEARVLQKNKKPDEAASLFYDLAMTGHIKSMHNLGVIEYECKHYADARFWFERAGLDVSHRNLEKMRSAGHWVVVPPIYSSRFEGAAYSQNKVKAFGHLSKVNLDKRPEAAKFWFQKMIEEVLTQQNPLLVLPVLSKLQASRAPGMGSSGAGFAPESIESVLYSLASKLFPDDLNELLQEIQGTLSTIVDRLPMKAQLDAHIALMQINPDANRQRARAFLEHYGRDIACSGTPLTILALLSQLKQMRSSSIALGSSVRLKYRYPEGKKVSEKMMEDFFVLADAVLSDVKSIETFAHEFSDRIFDETYSFSQHNDVVNFYAEKAEDWGGNTNQLYSEEQARKFLQKVVMRLGAGGTYLREATIFAQRLASLFHKDRYGQEFGPVREEQKKAYLQKTAELGSPFLKLQFAEAYAEKGRDHSVHFPLEWSEELGPRFDFPSAEGFDAAPEALEEPRFDEKGRYIPTKKDYVSHRVSRVLFPMYYGSPSAADSAPLIPELLEKSRGSVGSRTGLGPRALEELERFVPDAAVEAGVGVYDTSNPITEEERALVRTLYEAREIQVHFWKQTPYYCDDERNRFYGLAVAQIIEENHPQALEYYRTLVAGGGWISIGGNADPLPAQIALVQASNEGRNEAPYMKTLENWLVSTGKIVEPLRFMPMTEVPVQECDALSPEHRALLAQESRPGIKGIIMQGGNSNLTLSSAEFGGYTISASGLGFCGRQIFKQSVTLCQDLVSLSECIMGSPVFIKTKIFSCLGAVRIAHTGLVVVAEAFKIDPESMILDAQNVHLIKVSRIDLGSEDPFQISAPVPGIVAEPKEGA